MGRQGYVPLRHLGYVPLRRRWVFHLSLVETARRRNDGTPLLVLLRRHHDVPIGCRGDVPLRRLDGFPQKRCWVYHLRRNCDVAGTYKETSLRRRYDVLLLGGASLSEYASKSIPGVFLFKSLCFLLIEISLYSWIYGNR